MSDKRYPTGIHDPDWGRTLVQSQANLQPVGDPTRWGSSTLTLTPPFAAAVVDASSQLILVATRDAYSRSWGFNGTLSLPSDLWTPIPSPPPADFIVPRITLQIQQGVGQAQVLQEILLFGYENNLPTGLCWQQATAQGGPYLPYETPTLEVTPVPGDVDLTYSFSAIGALIGSQINIRARYLFQTVGAAPAYFPFRSKIDIVLTPFAAGQGL